uniref:Metallophos domain-containing protein n=1 Tax=Trichuris muris TaxID=70415 RepID=A0A5S6Q902_TRIMR
MAFYQYLLLIVAVVFFNEYLIFHIVIGQCAWPEAPKEGNRLNALIIADPHLLGVWRAHWFDKLRREWQMSISFATALKWHNPEVIFVLGDLFDEGMWSDKAMFEQYTARFMQLFRSNDAPVFAVVGNHDTGFHYNLHPVRLKWFSDAFGMDSVHLRVFKGFPFVLVNSMAMENDGCTLCNYALHKLRSINRTLRCVKEQWRNASCDSSTFTDYVRPILLQHFPLYRESDAPCQEPDAAPYYLKYKKMRQSWECLSKESSSLLFDHLQPRAVFSGHTHYGCLTLHGSTGIPEWSVSSFSWRNINNPAVLLVTFDRTGVYVSKCLLPRESTVITFYLSVRASARERRRLWRQLGTLAQEFTNRGFQPTQHKEVMHAKLVGLNALN